MTAFLEQLKTAHDIIGRQRGAIGKPGLRAQFKTHLQAIVRDLGTARDQSVHCIGFIIGAHHQRVEQQVEPLGRIALQNEAIQTVEGDEAARAKGDDAPPFGRRRIDVFEVFEVSGILQIAKGRQSMRGSGLRRTRSEQCTNKHQYRHKPVQPVTNASFDRMHWSASSANLTWID